MSSISINPTKARSADIKLREELPSNKCTNQFERTERICRMLFGNKGRKS